jgi:hypothetical protein
VVSSSLSTYLDVTQAAEGSSRSAAEDPVAVEDAAKILAALHGGTELITDLPAQTGLDTGQILAIIGSLAKGGLVELDPPESGELRVRLTAPIKEALASG